MKRIFAIIFALSLVSVFVIPRIASALLWDVTPTYQYTIKKTTVGSATVPVAVMCASPTRSYWFYPVASYSAAANPVLCWPYSATDTTCAAVPTAVPTPTMELESAGIVDSDPNNPTLSYAWACALASGNTSVVVYSIKRP